MRKYFTNLKTGLLFFSFFILLTDGFGQFLGNLTRPLCASPTDIIYTGKVGDIGPLGPKCVTLSTSIVGAPGEFTYAWFSTTAIKATTPEITVCPTTTTSYTLVVTDKSGASKSFTKTIEVQPLSQIVCSNPGDKIIKLEVCLIHLDTFRDLRPKCLPINSVRGLISMDKSDKKVGYLGPCRDLCVKADDDPSGKRAINKVSSSEILPVEGELSVNVISNPASDQFILQVQNSGRQTPATIRVMDTNGRQLDSFNNIPVGSNVYVGGNYNSGIYLAEVVQGNERKVVKLVKVR